MRWLIFAGFRQKINKTAQKKQENTDADRRPPAENGI